MHQKKLDDFLHKIEADNYPLPSVGRDLLTVYLGANLQAITSLGPLFSLTRTQHRSIRQRPRRRMSIQSGLRTAPEPDNGDAGHNHFVR